MDDEQGPWWTQPVEEARTDAPPDDVVREAPEPPPTVEQPTLVQPAVEEAPVGVDETAAVPVPRRPAVRRVAVIPPAPPPAPPASTGDDNRTQILENLPPDIFATFSGPDATPDEVRDARRGVPATDPADDVPRTPLRERLPAVLNLPGTDRRALMLGAIAVVAALVVVLLVLAGGFGGKDEPDPSAATAARKNPAAQAAADFGGKAPSGLRPVGDATAAAVLRQAGQTGVGDVVEAWSWQDENGANLVVTTKAAAGSGKSDLHVIHLVHTDADPRVIRRMNDPGLPACGSGLAGFTPGALLVRDLDGDGIAEVAVGWSSRCGGEARPSDVRLALISNGKKYIVRGTGVIGQGVAGKPDPGRAGWPPAFYSATTRLFARLYR